MHEQHLSAPERRAISRALWEYYSIHLIGQDELAEKTFRLVDRFGKKGRTELTRTELHIVLEALRLFSQTKARTEGREDGPLLAAEMYKKMKKRAQEIEWKARIGNPYKRKR